jgi:regulator of replication initiation timing
MSEENKKTATERLEVLENTANSIIQAIQPVANMAQDLMSLREAVKLLNNKLDSVVKAINAGTALTDENLNAIMTDNNAKELQDKVTKMVSDGLLVTTDTITKDSFVVINEQDGTGKIVNPRMQFLLSALNNEEVRAKLDGAKVGDNIALGDKGGSLNVLEAYSIAAQQPAPAADAAASAATDASATETTDATTASASDATASDSAPAATADATAPAADAAATA